MFIYKKSITLTFDGNSSTVLQLTFQKSTVIKIRISFLVSYFFQLLLQVAGWGDTAGENTPSEVLKWAAQRYVQYDECKKLTDKTLWKHITHDKFCASAIKGEKSSMLRNRNRELVILLTFFSQFLVFKSLCCYLVYHMFSFKQ